MIDFDFCLGLEMVIAPALSRVLAKPVPRLAADEDYTAGKPRSSQLTEGNFPKFILISRLTSFMALALLTFVLFNSADEVAWTQGDLFLGGG